MDKSLLTILIAMSLLSGCGGGSPSESWDEGNSNSQTPNSQKEDDGLTETDTLITISTINEAHVLSPTTKQDIHITGNNNIITINTPPNIVRVTGNDNTIKIENRGKVLNIGNGNLVLNLNGSVSTLN